MLVTNLSSTHFSVQNANNEIRIFHKSQIKDLYASNNKIYIVVNSVNNQEKIVIPGGAGWQLTDVYDNTLGSFLLQNTSLLTSLQFTMQVLYGVIWPQPSISLASNSETLIIAASDETTDLIVINSAVQWNMPYDGSILGIKANVNIAPTDADLVLDILKNGVSILSSPLVIDDGDTSSNISVSPAIIVSPNFVSDDRFNLEIVQIGSTDAGAGLKLTMRITNI